MEIESSLLVLSLYEDVLKLLTNQKERRELLKLK